MTAAVGTRRDTSWRNVVLVAIAFVVTMLGTTLPTPLYPRYAEKYAFGELMTTIIFSTYAVGVVLGLVLFGHWSDQVGRRPLLLGGLLLSGFSAVAFLASGPLALLFVGRLLSGLSAGIFTGTATATVIDLAPKAGKAKASLVAAATAMAGLGLGPLIAGVLAQYGPLPLRMCYLVDLLLVLIGLGCVISVREPVERAERPSLRPRALHVPAEMRGVFTRAAIAGFAGFAVMGLFTAVSPAFLGKVLGHTNAALLGVVVLSLFVASILGQTQSQRLGLDRAMPVGCVALIVGIAGVGLSLYVESLLLLVIGAVVAGYGQGLSFRAGLGLVSSAAPDAQRGAITSTFFVVLYIGISVPVIGEGALATGPGLVTAGIVFSALVALLAAVALVLLLRSSSAESKDAQPA